MLDSLQSQVIAALHDTPQYGHLGVDHTTPRLLSYCYWPGLRHLVVRYVANCAGWNVVKNKPAQAAPQSFSSAATWPGELVMADILKLPLCDDYIDILLLVDAFSKFPVAYPLENEQAATIARHLVHYISIFGVSQSILTDQGAKFESRVLISELCSSIKIAKLRTA